MTKTKCNKKRIALQLFNKVPQTTNYVCYIVCHSFLLGLALIVFNIAATAQTLTDGNAYQIKNKASAAFPLPQVLDVKLNSTAPGTQVWQYNLNLGEAQQFKFVDIGGGNFNILTKSGLYLTMKYTQIRAIPEFPNGGSLEQLIQDNKYADSNACRLTALGNCPNRQMWRLIPTDEPTTFFIQNLASPQKVLQPANTAPQSGIILADRNDNNNLQKWIIRRAKPDQAASEIGYGYLELDLSDFRLTNFFGSLQNNFLNLFGELDRTEAGITFTGGKGDIDTLCPQIRSVGETAALDKPRATYEVLEGTVRNSGVAFADFPTSHFTHDFTYEVKPDPQYEYLLASGFFPKQVFSPRCAECEDLNNELKRQENLLQHVNSPDAKARAQKKIEDISQQMRDKNCAALRCQQTPYTTTYDEYQKEIEVEWESGLGQNDSDINPAITDNKKGNSFGFFSAGHQPKDVIWNWAADGDRVHVEGIWVWERGHPPVHTEIHPPHFVAVQRAVPVSFILDANNQNPIVRNQPNDSFFATRVDVFANADGSVYWNKKNLPPYVGNGAFAQVPDMKRKDYTFIIKHQFRKPSATAVLKSQVVKQAVDNFPTNPIITVLPDNDVQVTVPWKSANVANTAIFARTILVYWDDPATKGVAPDEKPNLLRVHIREVKITDTKDTLLGGNFRIYCNVGSDWIFLNDFPVNSNFLGDGLGAAHEGTFPINKYFTVYIPRNSTFLIQTRGWEADGTDQTMGKVINGYLRQPLNIRRFVTDNLSKLADADDHIGNVYEVIRESTPPGLKIYKDINPGSAFNLVVEIERIN